MGVVASHYLSGARVHNEVIEIYWTETTRVVDEFTRLLQAHRRTVGYTCMHQQNANVCVGMHHSCDFCKFCYRNSHARSQKLNK